MTPSCSVRVASPIRVFGACLPRYQYHRVDGSIYNRPETGREYLTWAAELASRLDRGDTLGLRNAHLRRGFRRFLRGRQDVEAAFVRALEDGSCPDFYTFTRRRLDRFYQLLRIRWRLTMAEAGDAKSPVSLLWRPTAIGRMVVVIGDTSATVRRSEGLSHAEGPRYGAAG